VKERREQLNLAAADASLARVRRLRADPGIVRTQIAIV
jgi:hypothetical protein